MVGHRRSGRTQRVDEREGGAASRVTVAEFAQLFDAVRSWGRWGADDQLGAANRLTPDRVAAAARLVRSGVVVSLSLPLNTSSAPDCPNPAEFRITQGHDADVGLGPMGFAKDFVGVDYHSDGHTHIDALCHVAYKGRLYNGRQASEITALGPNFQDITTYAHGITRQC